MAKTKILSRQSLLDVAMQCLGSADAALTLAERNGLSVSDEVEAGTELDLPDVADREMATYYAVNGHIPATGIADESVMRGGINYMGIEIDFIVS